MEDDIRGDTSGHYRNLLTSLLAFSRPETSEVDMNLVRQDVDELVKAGVKKWGTDESKFNTIFGTRRQIDHINYFKKINFLITY